MLRFVIRTIGLIVLALGFVGIVLDGTRSMANATMLFASITDVGNVLFPQAMTMIASELSLNPAAYWPDMASLWNALVAHAMALPASVVGFFLGALLLKAGQKPADTNLALQAGPYR